MSKWTEYKNEQNPTIDWKVDKTLEGVYVSTKNVTTTKGETKIHTVEKKGGKNIDVWTNTMLGNFFGNIPEGTEIKLEYLGKEKGKSGNEYHNFKLEYDKDTMPQQSPQEKVVDEVFGDMA